MKIDIAFFSFILVLIIAIPVTVLRSKTYTLGYQVATLKNTERQLREENLNLKAQYALMQTNIITNYHQKSVKQNSNFQLPNPQSILFFSYSDKD